MTKEERKRRDGAILFGHINRDNAKVLGERHRLDPSQIGRILRSQGTRKKKAVIEKHEHIIALFQNGNSRKEIAEKVGMSYTGVSYALDQHGHSRPLREIECQICGLIFMQRRHNHAVCSDECQIEKSRRSSASMRKTDIGLFKLCESCGKHYKVYNEKKYRQRFCSLSCSAHHQNRKNKLRNREIVSLREVQGFTFVRIGEIFGILPASASTAYKKQKQIHDERLSEVTNAGAYRSR